MWGGVAEVVGVGCAAGTALLGRRESCATPQDASSSPFHLRPWDSELSLLSNPSGKPSHRPRGDNPVQLGECHLFF